MQKSNKNFVDSIQISSRFYFNQRWREKLLEKIMMRNLYRRKSQELQLYRKVDIYGFFVFKK